jgi:hypothetical protein
MSAMPNIGLSVSASSGAQAGYGDMNVFGGGSKQQMTLYIALAVVVLAAFVAWMQMRKGK